MKLIEYIKEVKNKYTNVSFKEVKTIKSYKFLLFNLTNKRTTYRLLQLNKKTNEVLDIKQIRKNDINNLKHAIKDIFSSLDQGKKAKKRVVKHMEMKLSEPDKLPNNILREYEMYMLVLFLLDRFLRDIGIVKLNKDSSITWIKKDEFALDMKSLTNSIEQVLLPIRGTKTEQKIIDNINQTYRNIEQEYGNQPDWNAYIGAINILINYKEKVKYKQLKSNVKKNILYKHLYDIEDFKLFDINLYYNSIEVSDLIFENMFLEFKRTKGELIEVRNILNKLFKKYKTNDILITQIQ